MILFTGCEFVGETDIKYFGEASLEEGSLSGLQSNEFGFTLEDYNIKEFSEVAVNELPQLPLNEVVVVNELPKNSGVLTEVSDEILIDDDSKMVAIILVNQPTAIPGFSAKSLVFNPPIVVPKQSNLGLAKVTIKYESKMLEFLDTLWENEISIENTALEQYYRNLAQEWIKKGIIIYKDKGPSVISIDDIPVSEFDILNAIQLKTQQNLIKKGVKSAILTSSSISFGGFEERVEQANKIAPDVVLILDIKDISETNSVGGIKAEISETTLLDTLAISLVLNNISSKLKIPIDKTDSATGVNVSDGFAQYRSSKPVIQITLGIASEELFRTLNTQESIDYISNELVNLLQ